MNEFWEQTLSWAAGIIVSVGLPFWAGLKIRNRNGTENHIDVDHETSEKAEKQVAHMDLREQLSKTHQCLAKFDSMKGFDENVMANFVAEFRKNDINADYLYIQALPAGTASYLRSSGTYELFVEKEKIEQSVELLKKIMDS